MPFPTLLGYVPFQNRYRCGFRGTIRTLCISIIGRKSMQVGKVVSQGYEQKYKRWGRGGVLTQATTLGCRRSRRRPGSERGTERTTRPDSAKRATDTGEGAGGGKGDRKTCGKKRGRQGKDKSKNSTVSKGPPQHLPTELSSSILTDLSKPVEDVGRSADMSWLSRWETFSH